VDLTEREREKYEKVWKFPKYRDYSPGEELVDTAIESLGMGATQGIGCLHEVIDFGCGTGRAAKKFQDRGYHVIGVDLAANCLDEGVDIPLINACLWELPVMWADWAFCTDVMEHIPEEKVTSVFSSIRMRTEKGAFFQIHTAQDGFGSQVGEVLHLTIKNGEWWKSQAEMFWDNVKILPGERGHRVLMTCRN